MSMKVKKSTVDDVKKRFEFLKNKKSEAEKQYNLAERLRDAKEEAERMQSYTTQVYVHGNLSLFYFVLDSRKF